MHLEKHVTSSSGRQLSKRWNIDFIRSKRFNLVGRKRREFGKMLPAWARTWHASGFKYPDRGWSFFRRSFWIYHSIARFEEEIWLQDNSHKGAICTQKTEVMAWLRQTQSFILVCIWMPKEWTTRRSAPSSLIDQDTESWITAWFKKRPFLVDLKLFLVSFVFLVAWLTFSFADLRSLLNLISGIHKQNDVHVLS